MALTKVQTIGIETGISLTGVTTVTTLNASTDTLSVGGTVNFGGNVSIAGTLTYEDVTNIDSVGIITARSGINVTGGDVGIGLTNPEDYGNFADDLVIYDSSQPGMTFASGTSGYGSIYFADGTVGNAASRGQIQYGHSDDYMAFATAATERMRIDSSGNVGINQTPTRELSLHSPNNNNSYIHFTNDDTGETSSDGALVGIDGNEDLQINNQESSKNIAFRTGGSERARIDSDGRLLVGSTSAVTNVLTFAPAVQVEGTTANTSRITAIRNAASAGSYPSFIGAKSRGTSNGSYTIVQSDDKVGAVQFGGADGAKFVDACSIFGEVDGTPGLNDMPGRLVFNTTSDGASSPTERLRITSTARFGFNTSNPPRDYCFHSAQADTNIQITNNTTGVDDSAGSLIQQDGNNLYIWNKENGFFSFGVNAGEKMRIDSSGRLLVGATSPANSSLNANIEIRDTSTGEFIFSRNDNSISANNVIGRLRWFGNDGGTYHEVARLSVAAADAHSNTSKPGQFLFSTTATSATTPTDRFRIDNLGRVDHFSSDGNGYDLHHAETGASDVAFQLKKGSTGLDDGTACMSIKADGDLENTNNRYTQISDIKFKENIVDASSQWEDLKAIRVVNFNFKAEKDWGTHRQIGVIAQEIETVSPGLICQRREENGEEYKSVAYSVLYMKAIKALQEAQTRIESLEARLDAGGL